MWVLAAALRRRCLAQSQAVVPQFHRRAVDHMDGHLETEGGPRVFRRKARRLLGQMIQGPPKNLFGISGDRLRLA